MDENLFDIELIARCLSGNASEVEKQELLSWMNQSRENEAFYFSLKDLYEAGNWNRLKQEAKTSEAWSQLRAKIQAKPQEVNRKPKLYLELVKYAAVFAVGALSIFMFKSGKESIQNTENKIVTGIGERTQMVLPDGTRVWVNSCSSVKYLSDYGARNRDIYLDGEAFFKVTKNQKLPFVVHTSGFNIRALGTSFNVSSYNNDTELSAVLLEGSISFGKGQDEKPAVLVPGEKISFSRATNSTKVEKVDPESYIAWSTGESRFENLTLGQIIKKLQRNYNVTFILDNEKIRNTHFTGTFRNYESLDQILKVISINANLTCKLVKDTVYMK